MIHVASPAELREALASAPAGETIELSPGEYEGLFVIDRPVTLRGKSRQTVLWRRGGPVVWVKSAGVKFDKVLIERTVNTDGPLIVYPKAEPVAADIGKDPKPEISKPLESPEFKSSELKNNEPVNHVESSAYPHPAKPVSPVSASLNPVISGVLTASASKGRESRALDALINLGELIPGSTLTLPLEVETTARAEITVSGLYGAQVAPTVVETAGTHIIWLTLDGRTLGRGEILLGEVSIRESGSGPATSEPRLVWLSGTVIDGAVSDRQFCLATKKLKLYPSRGLLLDGALLSALEGTTTAAGRYAYVQHDGSGALFIYLPADPPAPVLVNNHPVARMTRVLLREKDTVKFGSVALTVQPSEPLPFRVEPTTLTLPDFNDQFPEPAVLTVHNGKVAWKGHVRSTVPWANVLPDGDLRLPASRSSEWTVQLNSDALNLPDGTHEVMGGLLVVGNNTVVPVDVKLQVGRPDVALQIQPVDAGSIEWGTPAERLIDVTIGNLGRGTWTGTVRSNAGWLEVITPMPMSCEGWAESIAQIRVKPDWTNLPVGTYDLPAGLLVDSPQGNVRVPVKLSITPPRPHIVVVTSPVSFDQVERNAPLPTITMQIRNDGGSAWSGTVRASAGWVRVTPSQFADETAIQPGQIGEVEIHLNDVPAELELDSPVIIDEVRVEGSDTDEGSDPPIAVEVLLTVVELPPYLVANPVTFAPFIKGDSVPEGMLRIHNNGPSRWRGNVTSNTPLLNAPDSTFLCEAGDSISLYVTLNSKMLDTLNIGLNQIDGALSITGGRENVTATVYLDVRNPISELHLDTSMLNFGQVDGGAPELPVQMIRLVNASPVNAVAHVELCTSWLAVTNADRQFDIEVHGNTIIELPITLDDSVRTMNPTILMEDRAVTVSSQGANGDKEMVVQALAVITEWAPLLTITPAKLTLTDATPRSITVKNVGSHAWPMYINCVPWLAVNPIELVLEPDQQAQLNITRIEQSPDDLNDPRAVLIIGSGREVEVEVTSAGLPPAPDPVPESEVKLDVKPEAETAILKSEPIASDISNSGLTAQEPESDNIPSENTVQSNQPDTQDSDKKAI